MPNAAELSKSLGGFFTVDEAKTLDADNVYTINFGEVIEVGQGAKAEDKPVIGFKETKKRLVLSKGRCNQLTALFGKDDVVGKKVRLMVDTIQSREQIVIVSPE